MNDLVCVADILPFWRYAVGPTANFHPAIPFYRYAPAKALFEEAKRELPLCGVQLLKRHWGWIETIDLYNP